MIDKIQYAIARKFIVNELAYFAMKYQNEIEEAGDIQGKLVGERKLSVIKELADRYQIERKEIGLSVTHG